jgi:RND family efflux transporter MFP subunit
MPISRRARVAIPLALVLLSRCGEAPAPSKGGGAPAPAVTNRIPLPAEVIANLGITFAKARLGRLETRLIVPGRVEIAPEARFAVRAPSPGRVVTKATRWQRVRRGDVVAELLSEDLRAAQQALVDAEAAIERADLDLLRTRAETAPIHALAEGANAALAAAKGRAEAAEAALRGARDLEALAASRAEATRRLAEEKGLPESTIYAARKDQVEAQAMVLEAAERRDDLLALLPELALRAGVATSKAETSVREVAILERRKTALDLAARQQLRALAVLTGATTDDLAQDVAGKPAWLALESISLRAPSAGVVIEVAVGDGEWVEGSTSLVRIADPTKMVFHGEVPEADAARIPADAEVRIDVGCAECVRVDTRLSAPLSVADPRTRTVRVEARIPGDGSAYADGASAVAAVLLARSTSEEVLVPAQSVVQDELDTILFRRDPAKTDQVIRTPISIGRRADGWVEVLSEVGEGDEVVMAGVHQLRLTGIGKAPANGHFHSDGTWHEGKD